VAVIRLRLVDAFTDKAFGGNPAAVIMLDQAPSDEWMAVVAREMNVSDTAFVIREKLSDADFRLRWFTPAVEVELCGQPVAGDPSVPSPPRALIRSCPGSGSQVPR